MCCFSFWGVPVGELLLYDDIRLGVGEACFDLGLEIRQAHLHIDPLFTRRCLWGCIGVGPEGSTISFICCHDKANKWLDVLIGAFNQVFLQLFFRDDEVIIEYETVEKWLSELWPCQSK